MKKEDDFNKTVRQLHRAELLVFLKNKAQALAIILALAALIANVQTHEYIKLGLAILLGIAGPTIWSTFT